MFIVRLLLLGISVLIGFAMGQQSNLNFIGTIIALSLLITVPWLYMLPTYEAYKLKQPNVSSIAILNLFLGWTLLGWVVAAVWAFKKPEVTTMVSEANKTEVSKSDNPDIKICPFCAEEIKFKALVCKHCGKDQPAASVDNQ